MQASSSGFKRSRSHKQHRTQKTIIP